MSGMGVTSLTTKDVVIVGLISASIFAPFIGFMWWSIHDMNVNTARVRSEEASAKYPAGTIVKTKIGGFRGIVTSPDCYHGCSYWVRFPTASMQPQHVSEYEIQPWTDGKR